MPAVQLPLQIKLSDSATFANFESHTNEELVSVLKNNSEAFVYWYAAKACGKTHLLQALCHAANEQGNTAIYIPLKELVSFGPGVFEGIEQYDVICIDDIELIAGNDKWERALFNLYNEIRDTTTQLRVSASCAPNALEIKLKDLLSRLQSATVYQLNELGDEQKGQLLQNRARQRGFDFPVDVAKYVVTHLPRDMHSLIKVLDGLDDASLQEQRKITIPFVKKYLD